MGADVVAEEFGAQLVLPDRQHDLAAMRIDQHAAAQIARHRHGQDVVVEGISEEQELDDLDRGNARHTLVAAELHRPDARLIQSEEHASKIQSLKRITYTVFCLKK